MPDFSPSEQIFSNFFFCFVFPGNAAPAAENSRTKFSRQTEEKQARIFRAQKHEVYIFQHEASLFPAWPASSPEPNAFRPPAHSLPAPAGQHLQPPFFPYRTNNPKPANSLPPGLAGRRLISLPTTFLTSTNCHLPQYPPDASPPSLHHHSVLPLIIFLFLFFISLSTSFRSSPFRTYISLLSKRPQLLPSCCRFPNPQAARET